MEFEFCQIFIKNPWFFSFLNVMNILLDSQHWITLLAIGKSLAHGELWGKVEMEREKIWPLIFCVLTTLCSITEILLALLSVLLAFSRHSATEFTSSPKMLSSEHNRHRSPAWSRMHRSHVWDFLTLFCEDSHRHTPWWLLSNDSPDRKEHHDLLQHMLASGHQRSWGWRARAETEAQSRWQPGAGLQRVGWIWATP